MKMGINASFAKKEKYLESILMNNKSLQLILEKAEGLNMPNWYLGAGGIAQTVWNIQHGFDPQYGIKDYDLVYHDAKDISYEGENIFILQGKKLFGEMPVEIRNQARVHVWYEKHFGYPISPHVSVESAIQTWPTTATSVGIRRGKNKFFVFAPFGLDDLFNMTVRANKVQITKKIYENKADRWKKVWPKLKIIPWDDN